MAGEGVVRSQRTPGGALAALDTHSRAMGLVVPTVVDTRLADKEHTLRGVSSS